MPHDIEVVVQAIDKMLVYEREIRDAAKMEQYGGAKTSFYPSELGNGDRKIVYGFFKDKIGAQSTFTGQNARVFDNGDYVHMRYRDYMIRLGALLTEEQSIKVEQYDLERAPSYDGGYKISGRYDQIIDLNVIRAYVESIGAWEQFLAANYDKHEVITTVLDASVGSILEETKTTRWFPKTGYIPDPMIIDVKSMNPWGFKALAEKNDYSDIQGYLNQVNAYQDKLGIHKGGLLVEDKEKNRLHPVPVDYEPGRIQGDAVHEGLSKRLGRLWAHVKAGTIPEERCEGANVSKFPCKWSTGQCDFFSHCWDDTHQGRIIPGLVELQAVVEEVELPSIEEIIEYLAKPDEYQVSAIILYLNDFPGGQDRFTVTKDMPEVMLHQMLDFYADYVFDIDYVDLQGNVQRTEAEVQKEQAALTGAAQTITVPYGIGDDVKDGVTVMAVFESDADVPAPGADPLVNVDGTFNFEPGASVVERIRSDGQKEINCGKCQNLIVYKVLRGAKECTSCKHRNVVTRA